LIARIFDDALFPYSPFSDQRNLWNQRRSLVFGLVLLNY